MGYGSGRVGLESGFLLRPYNTPPPAPIFLAQIIRSRSRAASVPTVYKIISQLAESAAAVFRLRHLPELSGHSSHA